jgi:hypothetical protein
VIVEAIETYARFNGPWLQAWNEVNAASMASARVAVGQLELASLTNRFMAQRLRAYAEHDGRIDALVRRLDKLTEQFSEDYARQLREIYASWSDVLRQDRALSQVTPLRAEQRRGDERFEGRREDRAEERRPEAAAH